jgi:hypothetical protein
MAKNLKVSDDDKKEIERLFKDGLEAALKNPKKFWDAQRDRDGKAKPYSKLAAQPLLTLPSKRKKESVSEQMDALLNNLNKEK